MGESIPEKRRLFELEVLPELDVLFTAASSLAHNGDEANDFCEKTMVRAYQSFDRSVIGPGCRVWLLTILHAVVRESEEAAAVGAGGSSTSHRSAVIARGGNQDIDRSLQGLPDDFKAALVLVDIGRLSYREAAKVLEVPIETLRARISNGRALIRNALAALGHRLGRA
jgi:RNA polymerase sigma-70 factor (ECF subfamily)